MKKIWKETNQTINSGHCWNVEVIVGNLPFLVFLFTNYLNFPLNKYQFYNKNK